MLTEVIAECVNASNLANQAHLSEVSKRLHIGLLSPLQEFLDGKTPTSMSTLIEIADGIPAPRLSEQSPQKQAIVETEAAPIEDDTIDEANEQERYAEYSQTGNPKYDDMFNSLLESSKEFVRAGRKFKLDEIDQPAEAELEPPITDVPSAANNPPRMPGQKEKVEFDGMENWRSVLGESGAGAMGAPTGGDAGDIAHTLLNLPESEVEGLIPSSNPPQQSNPNMEVDSDVSNILSNL